MCSARIGERRSSLPVASDRILRDAADKVADGETLQRGVHGHWIDDDGFPKSAAFPVADLKDPARQGVSVHRRSPGAKAVRSLGRWPEHVDANTGAVRAILSEEGRQAFEVDAAPTAEDLGHALVRFADCANPPPSPRFERDKLLDVFRHPDFKVDQ